MYCSMGKVSAVFEVKPDGPEIDLDGLSERCKASLPEAAQIGDSERETIGFGVEKLVLQVMLADSASGDDSIQNTLRDIEGVQSVDIKIGWTCLNSV